MTMHTVSAFYVATPPRECLGMVASTAANGPTKGYATDVNSTIMVCNVFRKYF